MEILSFAQDSTLFTWVILPVLIFISRIADQSIGTLRLIFLSKGYKVLAPVLGFFEVIIWILAVGQIMQHLDNIMCYIAYGLGFATGNYFGILLDQKISLGNVLVRIIPKMDTYELRDYLRENKIGHTVVDAEGAKGPVKIIFTVIKRKHVRKLIEAINRYNPNAFYTIEDIRSIHEGVIYSPAKSSVFSSLGYRLRKIK